MPSVSSRSVSSRTPSPRRSYSLGMSGNGYFGNERGVLTRFLTYRRKLVCNLNYLIDPWSAASVSLRISCYDSAPKPDSEAISSRTRSCDFSRFPLSFFPFTRRSQHLALKASRRFKDLLALHLSSTVRLSLPSGVWKSLIPC